MAGKNKRKAQPALSQEPRGLTVFVPREEAGEGREGRAAGDDAQSARDPSTPRPSRYARALADRVCKLIETEPWIRTICQNNPDLPWPAVIYGWYVDDIDGFTSRFERSRTIGFLHWAEEINTIASTPMMMETTIIETANELGWSVQRIQTEHYKHRELMVNTRKWILAKALPKIFGAKSEEAVEKAVVKIFGGLPE
jgi:hypothetical protein